MAGGVSVMPSPARKLHQKILPVCTFFKDELREFQAIVMIYPRPRGEGRKWKLAPM